ncbi:uncharacterized protein [Centruroides vittatus]|uniref:uncharacterized protein n=1 Tax=Centruroides vittatus TaxID=120091 RepID=UPI00351063CA
MDINEGVVGLTDNIHRSLTKSYVKKMKWILSKQSPRKFERNITTYVVWDQVQVPERVKEVLSNGPNFVPENAASWETSIQEIERGLVGLDPIEKDYLRWKTIINNHEKWRRGGSEDRDIRYTKRWLKVNDLVAARADKSKQIVIMKRQTYNKALEEYLEETECVRTNDKIVENIDRRLKKLEGSKLSTILPFIKKCRNLRPGVPRLFAFAKTHKEGKRIRPIVEKIKAPTFFLEKRLHGYLSSLLEDSILVAKDPTVVVKELQDITLMDEEVGTILDYESMYPSVKIESCLEALMESLFKVNPELLHHRDDVLEMANLVCCESFFGFEGHTYKQNRGVPMGSPMSGLLCELVVKKIEEKVLHNFRNSIVYYKRYVDDILIIWRSNRGISTFIERINDNEDGLRLKLEQKSSVEVHFLDINITFKKGHLSTKVYTKPTHSPLYIPPQSNDPFRYKLAAFRTLVRRAFTYCDNVMDRVNEIDRIMRIAESLGYRRSVINGIVRKFEKSDTRTSKQRPSGYTKFTFNKNVRGIMKEIADIKKSTLIFKRAPNLYKILRTDKGKIKKEDRAGVYRIPYENQQLELKQEYIGVTTRNLGVRIKEHKYDARKSSNATVLAQMAQAEGSVVGWEEAEIVEQIYSPTLAKTAEKIEIYKISMKSARWARWGTPPCPRLTMNMANESRSIFGGRLYCCRDDKQAPSAAGHTRMPVLGQPKP